MKALAQKFIVAVAVVVVTGLGSVATDASAANPQATNQFLPSDKGGTTSVTVRHAPAVATVPQGRYRIGFLAD